MLICIIQSAWGQDTESGNVREKLQILFRQFDSLQNTNPGEASKVAIEIGEMASSFADDTLKAKSYFNLGCSNLKLGNRDDALQYLKKALNVYQLLDFKEGLCLTYKQLGTLYNANNEKEQALNQYLKALDIAEEQGISSEVVRINNNIAILFLEEQHFDKAINYFKESAKNATDLNDKAVITANIATSYKNAGDIDKASAYYQESYDLCHKLGNEVCEMKALGGLANISLEKKEYNKALKYTLDIKGKEERLGLTEDLLVTYNRMGLIYDGKGQLGKADKYFKQSISIADSLNSRHLPYIYANLAKAYENAGLYEKALEYTVIHFQKKDSLFNLDKEMQLEQLLASYETEKKEKEINLLKKEKELQEALLINNRNDLKRQQFAIIIFILIILIAIIMFVVYRQRVKSKELLAFKNEELNKQKTLELLREYELKNIHAFLEGQEREKKRIASDLHDSIAGTLAAIKLRMLKQLDNYSEDKFNDIIAHVDGVYQEVRTLSHHLTPYHVVRGSFISFLEKYLEEMNNTSPFEITFMVHGDDQISILTDEIKVELYRIIQEALTNVTKYAKAKTVDIQLLISEEIINLIIEDDGIGFKENESGHGIGLSNMKDRVRKLNGELNLDSSPGRGTIINVDIPLTQNIQTIQSE